MLFDPVDVPAELRERAGAVVLTCPWDRRDAPQLGLPIQCRRPTRPILIRCAERCSRRRHAAVRHPRIRRLRTERPRPLRREPSCGRRRRHVDRSGRWAPGASGMARPRRSTREDVIQRLRPLLDLPVDVVSRGSRARRSCGARTCVVRLAVGAFGVKVTAEAARRFLVARHMLAPARSLEGGPDAVLEVFRRLGSIQFDPIAVAGRSHDLVLHARVADYDPAWCDAALRAPRDLRGVQQGALLRPDERVPVVPRDV